MQYCGGEQQLADAGVAPTLTAIARIAANTKTLEPKRMWPETMMRFIWVTNVPPV